MKRALLDALDRSLLLALFAGGYVFAAVMLVASTWLALSGLGALGETGWAFVRERPVVVWVFCFCLLALAPLGWFFSRDVVPPIAARDPAERPALQAATIGASKLLIYLVGARAFTTLLTGGDEGVWWVRVQALAVLLVAFLAFEGVSMLAHRSLFARTSVEPERRHG